MPTRLSDLARRLFARPRRQTTPPPRTVLTLTSLEDRVVPTAVVTIAAIANGTEGGGDVTFRLTRTDTTGNLTVNLSVDTAAPIDGAAVATAGTDYTAPTSAMFPNGQATVDVTITPANDTDSEPTEAITLVVNNGFGYSVGSPDTATGYILDNDAQVVTVTTLNDAAEGGTNGVLRFIRIGDLSGSLTANYSVGGTGTSGTDFTSIGTSVTFTSGSATADVSVAALHDGLLESDETVTATATSGTGYSVGSPSSATVNLIDTDILPVAFDGFAEVSENDSVNVAVLDFATSLYGDTLTATAVTQGSDGSVVLNLDGTVTYTPDTDFVGDDSFTYTVEDPFGNESTGTVTVMVLGPQAPPTWLWTAANTAVSIDLTDLAFDPDGDALTVTAVTAGSIHGTVSLSGTTATYTPNTGYGGDDSFTYTVEDADGNEATNTITIMVGDNAPVTFDGDAETAANTAVTVAVLDLVYQPAGGLATAAVTQGAHGSVTINTDGTVTYTPDTGYTGTDTFTYTVTDANYSSNSATITVQVGPAAADPVDEIIDDLSDIEDEIEDYDVNSPPDLTSDVSAVAGAINDYLGDVTSFINATHIEPGPSLTGAIGDYLELYSKWNKAYQLVTALDAMLVASKNQIAALELQLAAAKAANNAALIDTLQQQILAALTAHNTALTSYARARVTTVIAYIFTTDAYRALRSAYPGSAAVLAVPQGVRTLFCCDFLEYL